MPVGFSTGETYDTEFDYLADRPAEAPVQITVTKRKDNQGEIFPADKYEVPHPENWNFINRMGLNADFEKLPEGTGENVIDDRNGERWNQTLEEYRKGNYLPEPIRSVYQTGVVEGKWDWNAFKNFTIDELKGIALYAPNAISKDAGFEDVDQTKRDPFQIAALKTRQSVRPMLGRSQGAATAVLNSVGEDVKKFGKSFLDAATLGPKLMEKVYNGEIDPTSEEGIKAVNDVALTFGTAGLMTAPLKPGIGLFGGRMSQAAVKSAEKMEKEGFSPISIKEMTGLERGADSFWRKELDDSTAKFKPKNFVEGGSFEEGSIKGLRDAELGKVLEHPEFFRAYPEAANDVVVIVDDNLPKGGYFNKQADMIVLSGQESAEQQKSILLHELQHYIQYKEGFAVGSAKRGEHLPKDFRDKVKGYLIRKYGQEDLERIADAIEREAKGGEKPSWFTTGTPSAAEQAQQLMNQMDYRLYRSVAGETEAWNVMKRQNMSAKERRQSLGKETEDVPRSEQIIHTKNEFYLGSQH